MNIRVEQKPLMNLLAQAQTIVEKKTTSQQLINVYLKAQEGHLYLYATDLEIGLVGKIPCEIIQEGSAAVGAKTFFEVVKELKPKSIQLIRQQNHWLDILQDRFNSKIIGIPPEEYPIFILNLPNEWVKIDSLKLKKLIQKTDYAISLDTTRVFLMGVYFEYIENHFVMVATDGHRLAISKEEFEYQFSTIFKNGIIIPKKAINEIKKILDDSDSPTIEISSDGTQFFVRKPWVTLSARLIQSNYYPQYQKLIPNNEHKAILDRIELIGSIKRVALFSSYRSKAITCSFNLNNLKIQTNSLEFGDAVDELNIEYKGPSITITYNPKYLIDALESIREDKVEFLLKNEEEATVVRGLENLKDLNIVMPMRI